MPSLKITNSEITTASCQNYKKQTVEAQCTFMACVHKITKGYSLASAHLSIRPSAWNNLAANGRILMKFDI